MLAPCIIIASPALKRPAVTVALCMVCNATGMVEACVHVMLLAGSGTAVPIGDCVLGPARRPGTHYAVARFHALRLVADLDNFADEFDPGNGAGSAGAAMAMPLATIASARFMPQARTRTRTSFGFSFGSSTSLISSPCSPTTAAFILVFPVFGLSWLKSINEQWLVVCPPLVASLNIIMPSGRDTNERRQIARLQRSAGPSGGA